MKKGFVWLLVCILTVGCFSACGAQQTADSGQLRVVTTIFPVYDWMRNILGEQAEDADITMLLDSGVDLHNYQPTVEDLVKISQCDLFVYVGGESDAWVEDALANATNKDMLAVNLLEVLGDAAKTEEIKEGMQAEEEDGDEAEYDEHIWLSLRNAAVLCEALGEKMQSIDPQNAALYKANTESYVQSLTALDEQYRDVCDNAAVKTVLFGDRFPFRYMADDYALDYYAAFSGCSAETEASFETVSYLAGKVDELGLHAVFAIEGSDQKIAQTIVRNTAGKDQKILSLNSMQSVTGEDVQRGETYLSVMTENLAVLQSGLA